MVTEIEGYAAGRRSDVAHGAETPALAGLMIEKFGYGLMKTAEVLGLANSSLLTAAVDRLVHDVNPQHRKHQQYRWASRPAGLSITDADDKNVRTA
ncbi:hypothetical protein [Burkholderia ubonensis]|uniref:hypothetical protein n=1 Tax=Burkholderia ubonensis TaxID=101571 RepID=UPI00075BB45D|nr:hypothetical protein [Burkholderia ubonensis]KVV07444.1 hypothetical protein WK77_16800 [Burkholderia ubonensis]